MNGRDCTYCGAHLTAIAPPLEPPRPPIVLAPPVARPGSDQVGMWVGGGIGALTLVTFATVGISAWMPDPVPPPPPKPIVTATAVPAPTVPPPPVIVTPDPVPSARITTPAAPMMTHDEWGKRVVASVSRKLKFCVEQDLLHTPGVPTAYTVTVTVGVNETASNVVFLTKPTTGFDVCGGSAIIRGFLDTKIHPSSPVKEPFTFVTNIAFPDAKPATVADHTSGGWP